MSIEKRKASLDMGDPQKRARTSPSSTPLIGGAAHSVDSLKKASLEFQNKKLAQSNRTKAQKISRLEKQIENISMSLENQRRTTAAFASVWDALEEDTKALSQRLDSIPNHGAKFDEIGAIQPSVHKQFVSIAFIEDPATVEQSLQMRKDNVVKALLCLSEHIERENSHNGVLLSRILESSMPLRDEFALALNQLQEKLNSIHAALSCAKEEYGKRYGELEKVKADYAVLLARERDLEARVQCLGEDLAAIQMKYERALDQIKEIPKSVEEVVDLPVQSSSLDSEEVSKLEEKIEEAKILADKRLESEEKMAKKFGKLEMITHGLENSRDQLTLQLQKSKSEKEAIVVMVKANEEKLLRLKKEFDKFIEVKEAEFQSLQRSSDLEKKQFREKLISFQAELKETTSLQLKYKFDLEKNQEILRVKENRLLEHEKMVQILISELKRLRSTPENFPGYLQEAWQSRRIENLKYKQDREKWKAREKELQGLLDAFEKKLPKEQRELAAVLANEKKFYHQTKELKEEISSMKKDMKSLEELRNKIIRLEEELSAQKDMNSYYEIEFESATASIESLSEQNKTILEQLKADEDKNFQTLSHSLHVEQESTLIKTQNKLLLEQISALEKSIEQRSQIEADLKSRINDISLKLVKLEEVRKRAESSAEYFKESATQSASDLLALKDVNEHLQKLLTDEEQKSLNLRHQLEELQRQIRRKNEDLAISQRKLAKFNAGITDMDSETELQYLKKRYRCTVCDERERSVIITRCYHLFCRECIETNIAKRNRKCPQCNKNFDKEDVHTFYL